MRGLSSCGFWALEHRLSSHGVGLVAPRHAGSYQTRDGTPSPALAGRFVIPKPPGKLCSRCVFILELPALSLCWKVGLRLLEMALLHFVRSAWEFILPQGQILTNDWQLQGYKYSSCVALVRMNLRCDQHCLQTPFVWQNQSYPPKDFA